MRRGYASFSKGGPAVSEFKKKKQESKRIQNREEKGDGERRCNTLWDIFCFHVAPQTIIKVKHNRDKPCVCVDTEHVFVCLQTHLIEDSRK